jgi:hypothetical protein
MFGSLKEGAKMKNCPSVNDFHEGQFIININLLIQEHVIKVPNPIVESLIRKLLLCPSS